MIDDNDTKSPEEADMNKGEAKVSERKVAKNILDGQDNHFKTQIRLTEKWKALLQIIHNIQ
jgi:hypothetical protein